MPLVSELEAVRSEATAINQQAEELCAGLSEQQLGWRPDPKRWSIAENFIHLRTTAEVFLPSVDTAIREAREKNWRSEGPFRLTRMGRFFKWYVEPPPVIRLPAPKPLRPLLAGPAANALPLFLESQTWVMERLEAANGLDLNRARVTSPLASFVRMDLLTIFHVFTGHARRHIYQATNVRKAMPSHAKS